MFILTVQWIRVLKRWTDHDTELSLHAECSETIPVQCNDERLPEQSLNQDR